MWGVTPPPVFDPALLVFEPSCISSHAVAARILAAHDGYFGPLQPGHIQHAYQNLNQKRQIPRRNPAKRLLR